MRILAFLPDYGGCGMYRVGLPMAELGERGHDVRLWDLQQGGMPGPEVCAGVEVVYFKRQWKVSLYDALDRFPGRRPKVVVDFDDLTWNIPKWHPKQYQLCRRELDGIIEVAKRADALTVSTPELAAQAKALNPNVYVCPNGIDFGYRDWENRARLKVLEGHLTIGWAGGDRSARDFEVIGPALREVLNKHRNVTLFLAGGEDCLLDWLKVTEVPLKRCALHPPISFETYPQLLTNIDIGLAPLASNEFNRCKSEIKLLEYGAWGIPYVASDVGPYRRFHRETEGGCGFLAGRQREWFQYLNALVSDARLREVVGQEANRAVLKDYSTRASADCWEKAFAEVIGGEAISEHSDRDRENQPRDIRGRELGGASAGDSGHRVRALV